MPFQLMSVITALYRFLSLVVLSNIWFFTIPLCPHNTIHSRKLIRLFTCCLCLSTTLNMSCQCYYFPQNIFQKFQLFLIVSTVTLVPIFFHFMYDNAPTHMDTNLYLTFYLASTPVYFVKSNISDGYFSMFSWF